MTIVTELSLEVVGCFGSNGPHLFIASGVSRYEKNRRPMKSVRVVRALLTVEVERILGRESGVLGIKFVVSFVGGPHV